MSHGPNYRTVEVAPDRCVLDVVVMVNLCTKLINLLGEVSIAFWPYLHSDSS